MNYPKEKYTIIKHQHPVHNGVELIAMSTYAGKAVKGKAICHVDDNYDEAKGIDLAVARCADRIAEKRVKRAQRKYEEAKAQLMAAQKYCINMQNYLDDAIIERENCKHEINFILKNM